MSLVVLARPLLAAVAGPPPGDYSGFMDFTFGTGNANDFYGPLCGTPQVGFDNTRLSGEGTGEPGFVNHWSLTDTSSAAQNPEHRWFTGTDDEDHFGFFEVEPDFDDYTELQVANLLCRYPALANGNVVDVRVRGRAWEESQEFGDAPYEINYSNQSDGWFYFQVYVGGGNHPDDGCSQCTCTQSPIDCDCSGTTTVPLLFQLTLGQEGTADANHYFTSGHYDWDVTLPVYRVTWTTYTLLDWTRTELVYAHPTERHPRAIFAANLPGVCSIPSVTCRVEVAQMQPYTIRDRNAFVDEVEDFCSTSAYCNVYRESNPPPGLTSGEFGFGGLANVDSQNDEGRAEENDLVAIEFVPTTEELPRNIIFVVAGDDYEPNGMFVAEGLIMALMDEPDALLNGGGLEEYEPVSFAIIFGSNPDNLSWGITHVRPYGDGEGRLWQGGMWGLGSLEYGEDENQDPVEHVNEDPEAVALRQYYARLGDPGDPLDAIGEQVAVLASLHGDLTPHPSRWAGAISTPGDDYFFPPVYGIWHYDGVNAANQGDPAAFTGTGALGYVHDRMEQLADYMRSPEAAGHSVYSRYVRPIEEWWPNETAAHHNFHITSDEEPADFASDPDIEPPIAVTFEFDEMALYLDKDELGQGEPCLNERIPDDESGAFRYCVQGYIDSMTVFRTWGKTLAWALRDTFHNLDPLPIAVQN